MKIFLLVLLLAAPLWAYPENIRHHYSNCITCHVSPTGGGLVTGYGRELSKEILSAYVEAKPKEEKTPKKTKEILPSWIKVGGHTRTLQTYVNTDTSQSGRVFLMQADVEALFHNASRQHMFVATVGAEQKRGKTPDEIKYAYLSRRHYYLTQPVKDLWVRAGKFQFSYGINTPEHAISTKRGIGLGEDTETYNAELSLVKERVNIFATSILGRPDDSELDGDKGFSLNASYFLGKSHKVGVSLLEANRKNSKRSVNGIWLLTSFTPRVFGLAEYDIAKTTPTGSSEASKSDAFYTKLGFEAAKGINLLTIFDSLKKAESIRTTRGFGVQYFPYSLVELSAQFETSQTKVAATKTSRFEDFAWFMIHIFL